MLEVPPSPLALTSDNVYETNAAAASVLTGVYTAISSGNMQLGQSIDAISMVSGLSADELTLYGGAANFNAILVQYYENRLNSGLSTSNSGTIWSELYSDIYIVNIAMERLESSTSVTSAVRRQLLGEAKFLRAFFYFYLVNLYGSVPLTTSSDYTANSSLAKASVQQVYHQIVADLVGAQSELSDGYVASDALTGTAERVRPNKWAATALLARAYLYSQNWDSSRVVATEIINHSSLYQLDSLNGVFLKNSTEAIWQLQPVNAGWNTQDAKIFVLPASGPTSNSVNYPVYLSPGLLSRFELNDRRRMDWVDSVIVNGTVYYFPYKYKSATLYTPVTEYTMVLRLGEQYLIRAEAEANLGGAFLDSARDDLNVIRQRAGLADYAGPIDQFSMKASILHERKIELFTEWGHRWLDLKRTASIDSVMSNVAPMKSSTWCLDPL